ncbi:histidinol phosphatase [Leptobacterium flavescens]|uniref:protein-tyrosine-phosphatase n=1 Tax=Leptobacterium flavescens TaxID=472055 RepID=A0A6P0UL17_9FLAO|nr:CpsB/CapC family capsule biosynthesis tyrosine phosphatase [Leptobacterium flavescens]NER13965.1 histidinol phosphatase [Leptobacterium flavescens]
MIQFFSKKQFLKDYLEGFVDIHCHILPGIDDGAANVEEAVYLIKKFALLGIEQFIATPHIMEDYYPNTDISIANAFEILQDELTSARLSHIIVNPAAEHMMDGNFEDLLENKNLLPLKEKYVLVEMSYLQPPINLEELIKRIRQQGYLPVLAHPERYKYYHGKKDFYKSLKQMGCFLQLNLLSLTEHYGKGVQKTAHYLLEENLIDFTGSDVHNVYQIEKISNMVITDRTLNYLKPIIKNTVNTFSVI